MTPAARREVSCPRLVALCLLAWLGALGGEHPAWADETLTEDQPVAEAYERSPGWLERAFQSRLRKKTLFPRLKDALASQPPFLRDTELLAHFRTYYLLRDNVDSPDNEAWAVGGWLRYRSGWLADALQIGATVYTSWPLYAPADKDGTLLLAPGQESYTVLGEAYVALRYGDHRMTGYRQEVDTPYVNRQDNRMTPNTFQGLTLLGKTPWFTYGAGYLTDMKPRNADEFISMGAAAGATGSDAGLAFASVGIQPWTGVSIEAINYFVPDVINIAYAEASYVWPLGAGVSLVLGAQFTDQRSVGDDQLTGAAFDVQVGGAKADLRYAGAALTVAVFHDLLWSRHPEPVRHLSRLCIAHRPKLQPGRGGRLARGSGLRFRTSRRHGTERLLQLRPGHGSARPDDRAAAPERARVRSHGGLPRHEEGVAGGAVAPLPRRPRPGRRPHDRAGAPPDPELRVPGAVSGALGRLEEGTMTDPRETVSPQDTWRRMMARRGNEPLMPYHRMLHRVDDGFLDAYNAWYEAIMLPDRPRALSPGTRELLVIVSCAATREQTGLRLHAKRALRLGVTPREILEAVTVVAITSGMPAMRDAMATLAETIPELAPPDSLEA